MVCAAQPWPLPSTQDLLEAMQKFSTLLASSAGSNRQLLLNREQFMSADIWLTRQPTGEGEFDRNSKVKEVIATTAVHVALSPGLGPFPGVQRTTLKTWDSDGLLYMYYGRFVEESLYYCKLV